MTRPYSEKRKIFVVALVLTIATLLMFCFVLQPDFSGHSLRLGSTNSLMIGTASYVVGWVSNRLKLPKYRKGISGLSLQLTEHRLFTPMMTAAGASVAGWMAFVLYERIGDERFAFIPLVIWALVMLSLVRKSSSITFNLKQEIASLRELNVLPEHERVIDIFQLNVIRHMEVGAAMTVLTDQHLWRIVLTDKGWEVETCVSLVAIYRLKQVSGDVHWLAFATRDEREMYLDFALGAHPFMPKREMKKRYNHFLVALYRQLDRTV